MKKGLISLIVLLLISGCGSVSIGHKPTSGGSGSYVSRSKLAQEKLNTPLEIGMTMGKVEYLRGKSYDVQRIENSEHSYVIWNYPGERLTFEQGILIRIIDF